MKKTALALTLSIVSVSCLQSSAWSTSSLLMQMPAILAAAQKSDTTQIMIGENGVITAFKGKTLRSNIKIYHGYALADSTTYEYSTVTGPSGLSVSADGVISYAVPASADTQSIPVSLRVKDKAKGKSYTKNVQIVVMATEIIASGTVGPTGGQIADELEEVVVTVPEGAVEGQTLIEVLRAVDENGYYTYTINASAPLLKILQMRLPDPILRKAPEGNLAQNKINNKYEINNNVIAKTRESDGGWIFWQSWLARFTKENGIRRLRGDIPSNLEPSHSGIENISQDAAILFSRCKGTNFDVYNSECGDKPPVLFIHGYTDGNDFGGGEGTWGNLPELISAQGYAVFEFTWRTNARFVDVASNLADAIQLIQQFSRKKVHIIAHSFGGLVSRAFLQNYATGRPYQGNVQSLITLGTPHSGIFPENGTYHGLSFLKGQDFVFMDYCKQISCHQAGVSTGAYTVPVRNNMGEIILFVPIDDWLGIDTNPGEFVAQIQDTSGEHGLPVDVLTLIGLPVFKQTIEYETYSKDYYYYMSGDGLITYAGQRFNNGWGNNEIKSEPQLGFGFGKISEKILGVSGYDKYALPYREPSATLLDLWFRDNFFTGYFHSSLVMDSYGATEANVEDALIFHKTNAPHAALAEIKTWLKSAEPAEPLAINLNLQVIDAGTQFPVSEARVYFNANGMSCNSLMPYGTTNISGVLKQELPFYPLGKYTALVVADGYKSDEFDTGYTAGLTPGLSGTEFGTIRLQKGKISTVTSATGRIWMDRNLGASRAATSMTDTEAYGDLYQWGRGKDGHEKRTSGTTATLSSVDIPGHNLFITVEAEPQDWRNSQNDSLWQGANGINNPCPAGFRLPTTEEWQAEMDSWNSKNAAGAFASPLKLAMTGVRSSDGTVYGGGDFGMYWSSTAMMDNAFFVDINNSYTTAYSRANGLGVRCIKD